MQKPDAEFEPNLVNTVCFLVQWVVQLTTFAVNYIGHPFNQSLAENAGLAMALRWGMLGFVVATLNLVPYTDWALSLVSRQLPWNASLAASHRPVTTFLHMHVLVRRNHTGWTAVVGCGRLCSYDHKLGTFRVVLVGAKVQSSCRCRCQRP